MKKGTVNRSSDLHCKVTKMYMQKKGIACTSYKIGGDINAANNVSFMETPIYYSRKLN